MEKEKREEKCGHFKLPGQPFLFLFFSSISKPNLMICLSLIVSAEQLTINRCENYREAKDKADQIKL